LISWASGQQFDPPGDLVSGKDRPSIVDEWLLAVAGPRRSLKDGRRPLLTKSRSEFSITALAFGLICDLGILGARAKLTRAFNSAFVKRKLGSNAHREIGLCLAERSPESHSKMPAQCPLLTATGPAPPPFCNAS
jgi:hypothetical protein